MKPASLRRLALAVFLMFSVLGPIEILMESNMKPLAWSFILTQTVICGGIAASIILTMTNKKLFVLSIIFWSLMFVLTAKGLFFEFNGSGMQVHFEQNKPPGKTVEPLQMSAEELTAIYTQRGMIGALAIFLLSTGYAAFIYVIRMEVRQRARLETEVQIAGDIQTSLLPEPTLKTPWCEIAGLMLPATEVGGDYFDVIRLGDSRIAIVIADVTGHGVGAGILSSMTKSALRLQLRHDPSPVKVFENLNSTIYDLSNERTFVTCAYLLLDNATKELRYSTAGHPPIFYLRNGEDHPSLLRTPNPGLGMRQDGSFSEGKLNFNAGDRFLLYTDGVTEAMNRSQEQFGMDRLERLIIRPDLNPEQLCKTITGNITNFTGTKIFQDDVTLVGGRFI